jgi:hypothetical protein
LDGGKEMEDKDRGEVVEKKEKEERQEVKKEEKKEEKRITEEGGKGGLSLFKVILINVLVSLLVSVGVVYVYDRYYAQKIVAFDLQGYIIGLRDMYMSGKIDDEGLKRAIDAAYAVIKSQRKNKVVLMGDVILTPVEKIEYPVKIEFSSIFPNINGTQRGIGGGVR